MITSHLFRDVQDCCMAYYCPFRVHHSSFSQKKYDVWQFCWKFSLDKFENSRHTGMKNYGSGMRPLLRAKKTRLLKCMANSACTGTGAVILLCVSPSGTSVDCFVLQRRFRDTTIGAEDWGSLGTDLFRYFYCVLYDTHSKSILVSIQWYLKWLPYDHFYCVLCPVCYKSSQVETFRTPSVFYYKRNHNNKLDSEWQVNKI